MTDFKIFTGNSNPDFARKVAECAGTRLGHCEISTFADGEIQVEIQESVRGCRIFLVQSACPPVNQNYMETQSRV